MSALQPPVSEDLIVKMAALTTRDTVSLSQFQERYKRQTEAFQAQKSPPNPKFKEYVCDVGYQIDSLSQKGQETLKKLLEVLNKQGGVFSASDVAEGTANLYQYHAVCKTIRRDIKFLAIFTRQDAEELKSRYVEVVTTLYDKFYGVCNEHLSQELQNRSKGRETVTDVTTLNTTDRSFEYKITMADQTIETLHKLRMDVKLPTLLPHEGYGEPKFLAPDLKKVTDELDFISGKFIEKTTLPSQQDRMEISRKIRAFRKLTLSVDFNTAYEFRSQMNRYLETFAQKMCSFAVAHILKKDLEARQLVGALAPSPASLPVTQLLELQTATTAVIEDSKKMLELIAFATQLTKMLPPQRASSKAPEPTTHTHQDHRAHRATS